MSGLLVYDPDLLRPKQLETFVTALLQVRITALVQPDRMLALGVLLKAVQVCSKLPLSAFVSKHSFEAQLWLQLLHSMHCHATVLAELHSDMVSCVQHAQALA